MTLWKDQGGSVLVIGDRFSPSVGKIKNFLAAQHVSITYKEPTDQDETVSSLVTEFGSAVPIVHYPDGHTTVNPSQDQLAACLGVHVKPNRESYDVAIVGGGPAGLAAAVYGASEGLKTILIEGSTLGGQAGTSSRIENYLGFPDGLTGADLTQRAVKQAHKFGAEVVMSKVIGLVVDDGTRRLILKNGTMIECKALVLSMGVDYRKLTIPGANKFTGAGIYYGASMHEAASFEGGDIYLIGGGNSAGQAAKHFAKYCRNVNILIRRDDLSDSMSDYLIKQLEGIGNIKIHPNTEVIQAKGDGSLSSIVLANNKTNETRETDTRGVFVFIGAKPRTEWVHDDIHCDTKDFILTGSDVRREGWGEERDPYLLEASCPGVFAVGDVRSGSIKRVATAAGEGAQAIAFIHQYLRTYA